MLKLYEPNVKTTISFLKLLHVKLNAETVNETLQAHPDWPSLLSISDSLKKWHIPNAAGKIDLLEIDQLPTPFIAYANQQEAQLKIVTQVTDSDIYFYQSKSSKLKQESRDKFKWSGVYLIAEPNEYSGETDYKKNRRNIFLKSLVPATTILLLVIASFLAITETVLSVKSLGLFSTASLFFQYFISLTGIAVTSLLLWYEIDKENPTLKKFCTAISKTNCHAILTGKQAKVFSWLSWSEAGFFYFTGGLITLLFTKASLINIAVIGGLNVLAAPYIFFSIYYQSRIARQWCPLCLAVQVLLLLGAINAITGNFVMLTPLDTYQILPIILFYLIIPLVWYSVKPYLLRLQSGKSTQREYLRIKFNEEIFNTLLKNQKPISASTDDLGIVLGNRNASFELVKVCNPYCGPCSRAHSEIDKLLEENSNLKVRIIFTATNQEEDIKANPAKHLLAIASKNDEIITKRALDDWYLANRKDYNAFAIKYPMNGELKQQNEKIDAMDNWCNAMEITATPTLFIKGHKLPDTYNIRDITYFLSE